MVVQFIFISKGGSCGVVAQLKFVSSASDEWSGSLPSTTP